MRRLAILTLALLGGLGVDWLAVWFGAPPLANNNARQAAQADFAADFSSPSG